FLRCLRPHCVRPGEAAILLRPSILFLPFFAETSPLRSSLSGCHDRIRGGLLWWGRLQHVKTSSLSPRCPGEHWAPGERRWTRISSFVLSALLGVHRPLIGCSAFSACPR